MKKTLLLTTLVISTSSVFAASSLVDSGRSVVSGAVDGGRAVVSGAVDGGRAVLSGAAAAGKGLLNAPKKLLSIGDNSLPNLSAGISEFSLTGNVNWGDDVAYNFNLGYGYFFQDNWQVGFKLNLQGEESDINVGLGLFTEYNFFLQSKWVPFVGFAVSWEHLDGDALDADSISLGLDLGIKYFIRENLALSFSIGAKYAFDDVFPGGDDFAKQVNIGTRFYF